MTTILTIVSTLNFTAGIFINTKLSEDKIPTDEDLEVIQQNIKIVNDPPNKNLVSIKLISHVTYLTTYINSNQVRGSTC